MTTLLAPLSRTAADLYATNVVREMNLGRCQLTGATASGEYGGGNWCHRVAEGRGGPKTPANGLWLRAEVHSATHSAAALSHSAGWMVDTGTDPRTVPVLCLCQGIPAWWTLDASGDGMARLATAAEVAAAGLDPALTLPAALAELTRVTGWRAA